MKKCQPRVLTPYLDGELADDARAQVEEHLRGCASCGALLDEVTSARERVHGMGRSLVPNTILMPALEAFRDRAGLSPGRQLELAAIPTPNSVAFSQPGHLAPGPVASDDLEPASEDVEPAPAAPALADTAWTPRFIEPPFVAPPPIDVEAAPAPVAEALPVIEADAPADAVALPAFPPLPPDPHAHRYEDDASAYADAYTAAVAIPPAFEHVEPDPEVLERDAPEPAMMEPEVPGPALPGTAAAEVAIPEVDRPEYSEADALASEAAAAAALDARPEMPAPLAPPPWLEAEAADAEDIEARGRRFVEEDLRADGTEPAAPPVAAPPVAAAPESAGETAGEAAEETRAAGPGTAAHAFSPSGDGLDEAVAGMRRELDPHSDMAPVRAALAAVVAPPAPPVNAAGQYREALRSRRERERPAGLGALDPQVKLGLGAAAAVLLLLVAVFTVPRLISHPASTVATAPSATAAPTATPTARATTPTAAPTGAAGAAVPDLGSVVTGGAGGSGFTVSRIRVGNPASGVWRLVFDLGGGGATLADARLGRGPDGNLYLVSEGTTIDPSILSSFPGAGPVTAITANGGGGLSLKLATTQQPQFSMYYLTGPNRLVIDLK